MPSPILPVELRAAAELMIGAQTTALRGGVTALHDTYRDGGRSAEDMDFGAYLAARLPATYAAVARVLDHAVDHIPEFSPQTMVDVGSGPGTASWAAAEAFPSLEQIAFLDSNQRFLDLALQLSTASSHPALRQASGHHADMTALPQNADLVIAAYALAELSETKAAPIAQALWQKTDQVLVLVEPGTPAGFARLRLARTALVAAGAQIAAPCPHNDTCPIVGSDWCHFSVRLPRSRTHMQAKAATVPFEDERFAYLVATRGGVNRAPSRILSPTHLTKPGVALRLCGPEGINTRLVAKREGVIFKTAKKAAWGDPFE